MSKEAFYFTHDYESTNDPKIQALLGEFGAQGYGIYWRVVEMLHSDSNHKLPFKKYLFLAIAKQMLTSVEQIEAIIDQCINVFELFSSNDDFFWSNRVLRNFELRAQLSEKRAIAGRAGAIAKQIQANSSKEKESKVKKSKVVKKDFDYSFISPEWLPLFTEWINYKKSRNEMYKTQDSLKACYRNLLKLSNNNLNKGREVIDQATGNNWAGLFPLKGGTDQEEPFKLSIITGQQSK